jgi:hypothetical protein
MQVDGYLQGLFFLRLMAVRESYIIQIGGRQLVYNEQTVNSCAFYDSNSVCCSKRAEKEFTLLASRHIFSIYLQSCPT